MTGSDLEDSLTDCSITFARKFGSDSIFDHVVNEDRVLAWIWKRDEVVEHAKSETFLWVSKLPTLRVFVCECFEGWDIFRCSI